MIFICTIFCNKFNKDNIQILKVNNYRHEMKSIIEYIDKSKNWWKNKES